VTVEAIKFLVRERGIKLKSVLELFVRFDNRSDTGYRSTGYTGYMTPVTPLQAIGKGPK
jgi:hypothetical protein